MNLRAILLSVVVGVLTVVLLSLYLRRLEVETSGGGPVAVIAAVKPLEPGTIITPDMIAVKVIPQAFVESRAVRKADVQQIIGIKVETAVKPQQTLMWTDLAVTSDDRRQLSTLVQSGMRAVGVRAGNDDASFGLIRPGDRVDVYASLAKPGNEKERVSVLVVQNVLVLAVGLDMGTRELLGGRPTGDRNDQVLTLSTTPQQLQLLSLASERGKLTVGVRNPSDPNMIDSVADVPSELLTAPAAVRPTQAGPTRPTLVAAPMKPWDQ